MIANHKFVSPTSESPSTKFLLILIAMFFVVLLIVLPAVIIFTEAFRLGFDLYLQTFNDIYAISAIKLTLLIAFIVVLLNLVFGIAASWAITKFNFVGKHFLISLIDLPFSVSPVIAGLIYVLLFGSTTFLGKWLIAHHIHIVFAVPGLIIATIFVTVPYIARELIPLMSEQGKETEEIAILMGATGSQTFWHITLPNISLGLLYGVLLCNARAMGEFGAVTVISGHIMGKTNTIPLYIEILYNEYNFVAAFSMATLLTLLALVTLLIKTILDTRNSKHLVVKKESHSEH